MKYMLLIYANNTERPNYSPEQIQAAMQLWQNYANEAKTAGVLVSNETLFPIADATTVRVRDGKTLTADGPFAETHEQLGGYFVLDCKDLDDAISWAGKMPGARYGSVEVRPIMSFE